MEVTTEAKKEQAEYVRSCVNALNDAIVKAEYMGLVVHLEGPVACSRASPVRLIAKIIEKITY